MIHALSGGLFYLAQLKVDALKGDPPPLSEGSEALTLVLGTVLVVGILLISFRPAKRDRAES